MIAGHSEDCSYSVVDTDRHDKDDEPVTFFFEMRAENNSGGRTFQLNADLAFIKMGKRGFKKTGIESYGNIFPGIIARKLLNSRFTLIGVFSHNFKHSPFNLNLDITDT